MRILYKLVTNSYVLLVNGFAPFNRKAQEWVQGRAGLQAQLLEFNLSKDPVIWFHCASLGEFEQGKPVMEAYKARHPNWKILVTFFSPSGYKVQKNTDVADYVMYLPVESAKNVKMFLDYFEPKITVFVKYEFWYDYMNALHARHIPLIFISSTFRKDQLFFRKYGLWFLEQLKTVEMFFVQDLESKKLLENHGITKVEVSGDTRFDRVLETLKVNEDLPKVSIFKGDNKILIFGSAWRTETKFSLDLIPLLPTNWKVIYAPHEISSERIDSFEQLIDLNCVRYSDCTGDSLKNAKVLIVDTVGHLARMYKYADIAIVGGGFNDGIHNILEPLTFGVPVFFGDNHKGFHEAEAAMNAGVGFEIENKKHLELAVIDLIQNPNKLKETQIRSKEFIKRGAGATKIISNFLNKIGQIISCQIC